MQSNHHKYLDTIIMKGKVSLNKGGLPLMARATQSNIKDFSKVAFTLPIKHTTHRSYDLITPELVKTIQFDGRVQIHTSKDFTAEYGYDLFMQIPSWIYSLSNIGNQLTPKQITGIKNTPIMLQIKITSLDSLLRSPSWSDFLTTKYDGVLNELSDAIWDYILEQHPFHEYGIESYEESNSAMEVDRFSITQLDMYRDIPGRYVKDILELVSVRGYYARKNMRIWNNAGLDTDGNSKVFQDSNGIEFRAGKKSSEIYKFYDKDLENANKHYQAIYTASDVDKKVFTEATKGDNTKLRYEVSLRRVASQRDAIKLKYGKVIGEYKNILLRDVLDNTIYSRVPQSILRDGLFNIFGGEIEKPLTDITIGENDMTDTDILQEYGTTGLKYLGVKYLMDKGQSNDQIWKYMVKRGGISYEVIRRLRKNMKDDGIIEKMNDGHQATMNILRDEYNRLSG